MNVFLTFLPTKGYVSPGKCNIVCIHGLFGDIGDSSVPYTRAISLHFECYRNASKEAFFGYGNPNEHNVYVDSGLANLFTVNGIDDPQAQFSIFRPGIHNHTFSLKLVFEKLKITTGNIVI